jgi:hypothetical protein
MHFRGSHRNASRSEIYRRAWSGHRAIEWRIDIQFPAARQKKAPAGAGANAEEIEHRSSSEARLPSPRPSTRQRREHLAWKQ